MNLFTHASLSQGLLKNLTVILPTFEQLISISNYLEIEIIKVNRINKMIEDELILLSEYKTSLISSVVTGKIDV